METSILDTAFRDWKLKSFNACIDSMSHWQMDSTLRRLGIGVETIDPAYRGWLKAARFASHLSTNEIARRLGTSRSAYSQAEARELRGAITIAKMRELADAMDCDFVYELQPRSGSFTKKIWDQVLPITLMHPRFWRNSMPVHPSKFSSLVRLQIIDAKTRRALRWTERLRPK